MTDSGSFNSANIINGTQYFVRVDKYFKKDRIYGSFFRTLQSNPAPNVIPQFSTTNNYWQRAVQVDWTHDFSPYTLNEVIFAQNRIEGKLGETATSPFRVSPSPDKAFATASASLKVISSSTTITGATF